MWRCWNHFKFRKQKSFSPQNSSICYLTFAEISLVCSLKDEQFCKIQSNQIEHFSDLFKFCIKVNNMAWFLYLWCIIKKWRKLYKNKHYNFFTKCNYFCISLFCVSTFGRCQFEYILMQKISLKNVFFSFKNG